MTTPTPATGGINMWWIWDLGVKVLLCCLTGLHSVTGTSCFCLLLLLSLHMTSTCQCLSLALTLWDPWFLGNWDSVFSLPQVRKDSQHGWSLLLYQAILPSPLYLHQLSTSHFPKFEFARGVITRYHKLSGLNHRTILFYSSGRSRSVISRISSYGCEGASVHCP